MPCWQKHSSRQGKAGNSFRPKHGGNVKNGTVVITKRTFELLLGKFFTRPSKINQSGKYKTFFTSMKYYTQLEQEIHAIRVNKECFSTNPETYFCVQASYWNRTHTKHYRVICIHPNSKKDRAARGLSDIIPAPILRAISWKEDFENDLWTKNVRPF